MSSYIPVSLRQQVAEFDKGRCCYCLTQEINSGISLSFEHVLPQSKGGKNTFENICLACRSCNEFKASAIGGTDLLTGQDVTLFNPRSQEWTDHFEWSKDGTRVEGLTAIGRVTVRQLRMNRAAIVVTRRRWVASGWHPPKEL